MNQRPCDKTLPLPAYLTPPVPAQQWIKCSEEMPLPTAPEVSE